MVLPVVYFVRVGFSLVVGWVFVMVWPGRRDYWVDALLLVTWCHVVGGCRGSWCNCRVGNCFFYFSARGSRAYVMR